MKKQKIRTLITVTATALLTCSCSFWSSPSYDKDAYNKAESQHGYQQLQGKNLSGANLDKENFNNASLKEANLNNASLKDTNLEGADLTNANLEGAKLNDANLTHAIDENTDFTHKADLRGAYHQDENSVKTPIDREYLDTHHAKYDKTTLLDLSPDDTNKQ